MAGLGLSGLGVRDDGPGAVDRDQVRLAGESGDISAETKGVLVLDEGAEPSVVPLPAGTVSSRVVWAMAQAEKSDLATRCQLLESYRALNQAAHSQLLSPARIFASHVAQMYGCPSRRYAMSCTSLILDTGVHWDSLRPAPPSHSCSGVHGAAGHFGRQGDAGASSGTSLNKALKLSHYPVDILFIPCASIICVCGS